MHGITTAAGCIKLADSTLSSLVLDEEGRGWEYIFSYARRAQLDTKTDDIMIERATENPDKMVNAAAAYTWTISLVMAYFVILPFSLQYSSVFLLMFVAMLRLNKIYHGFDWKQMGIFFLDHWDVDQLS